MLSLQCAVTQAATQHQRITSGSYISSFMGYAFIDWTDFDNSPFVCYDKNSQGGFAYGASLGYRFYRYFALEGGWVNLPTVSGNGLTNADSSQPVAAISVASWYGYLQGKLFWQFYPDFFVNAGIGVAYREIDATPSELFTNAVSYYYAPIFSLSLQWDITQDWFCYLQYTYLPSFDEELAAQPDDEFDVPSVNFVAIGVAYKFAI